MLPRATHCHIHYHPPLILTLCYSSSRLWLLSNMTNLFLFTPEWLNEWPRVSLSCCTVLVTSLRYIGSISGTMDGTFPNISQTIPDFDTLTLASRTAKPYEYGWRIVHSEVPSVDCSHVMCYTTHQKGSCMASETALETLTPTSTLTNPNIWCHVFQLIYQNSLDRIE